MHFQNRPFGLLLVALLPAAVACKEQLPERQSTAHEASATDAGPGAIASTVGADGGAGAPVVERPLTLLTAGAEPRVARRYTFSAGSEKRTFSMQMQKVTETQGQRQEAPAMPMHLTVLYEPGGRPGALRYSMRVQAFGLDAPAGTDPAIVAQGNAELAVAVGASATFGVTPRGSHDEPTVAGTSAPKGGESAMEGIFSSAAELVFVPFPEEPIGMGATWRHVMESTERELHSTITITYTLTSWSGDSGVVDAVLTRSVPRQLLKEPRMPGAMIELQGRGTYHFVVKLSGVATRATADVSNVIDVEVPDAEGHLKPTMKETARATETIE